jgi:hypothetical protein
MHTAAPTPPPRRRMGSTLARDACLAALGYTVLPLSYERLCEEAGRKLPLAAVLREELRAAGAPPPGR